jgi:hypothetical protein
MLGKASKMLCVTALVVLMVALATPSFSQVVASDSYQVNYYSGADGGRGTVRVINTGQIGSPIDPATKQGTICADIYVFDNNQEMLNCCGCKVTANGLLTFDVFNQLLYRTLTTAQPPEGVVKIVSARTAADGSCDATNIVTPVESGLRAFETHVQVAAAATTETLFQTAPLTNTEQAFLGNACSFVIYLGSGQGKCKCAPVT